MLRLTQWTTALLVAASTTAFAGEPDGREIFERVWKANDSRSHGGDGLGPVFNAKSCVACHDQGGAGGGGALEHNVTILSAAMAPLPVLAEIAPGVPKEEAEAARATHEQALAAAKEGRAKSRKLLVDGFHTDFEKSDAIVIHAHGTDTEAHAAWRQRVRVPGQQQEPFLIQSDVSGPVGFNVSGQVPQNFNPIIASGFIHSVGINPQSFPMLTELSNGLNTIKAKRNPNHGTATVIGGGATIRTSQRNTTALWGAGLIDSIPDEAIEAIAERQREAKGRVSGRPSRLDDGKLGRFGWKGQKSSLYAFTIAACANELGLEVPGAHQATVAYDPEHEPKGYDLNANEVAALVDYIASLPVPAKKPVKRDNVAALSNGHDLFVSVGCAECHVERVGEVDGLFSDLLLHDMGADLGAVGSYGVPSTPVPDPEDVPIASAKGSKKPVPATAQEWRTAPLWGVASSAPYLHDGRAKTIEQAIAFHGGEAAESRLRWMLLRDDEKKALEEFLGSLVAPEVASRD